MATNLPWLQSRLKIFYALFFDILIILISYLISNPINFKKIEDGGISFYYFIIFLVWILSSYILGRYVFIEKKIFLFVLKKFVLNIICFFFCFLSILMIKLIIGFNFNYFISDLNPLKFFLLSNFIILTYQLIFYRFLLTEKDLWFFWGSKESFNYLNKLVKDVEINLNILTKSDLKRKANNYLRNKKIGIIIENIDQIPQEEYKELINYREKGFICISLQDWIEKYLERLEYNLIKEKFLILNGFYFPNNSIQLRIKRIGDLITSTLLIVLSFPIILFCGIIIYLEDGGPILYSQKRTGFSGKHFCVYKLRTMSINAEEKGYQWSMKGDKRITKIGSFLRKFRIDELPQLWCVIKGEMSLIGPRPERPEFDLDLNKLNQNYKYRYFMRPGLSGWAQVNYPYGASNIDAMNKLSYDLYYIRNFSNLLDLVILFKTIKLLIGAKGAIAEKNEQ